MRWPILSFCTTLAVTFLGSHVARADTPTGVTGRGEMIVYLTGGRELRGSIVEMATGKYYVVLRADGVTLKIPWTAVRAITPPNAPAPPPEPISEKKVDAEPSKREPSNRDSPSPPPEEAPLGSAMLGPPPRAARLGPTAFVELLSEKRIQLQ